MNYQLDVQELDSIRRRLDFTISAKVVDAEVKAEVEKMKGTARMRGFRPGKVPAKVLMARYGDQIRADVGQRLVDQSWRRASTELEVAGAPRLVAQNDLAKGTDLTFSIEVEVNPAIQPENYSGIAVSFTQHTVAEEDVDRAVESKLAGQRRIGEVEEARPVQAGDFVLTHLTLTDGEEEVIEEPGTLINTGAERFYPGIEALLVGMSLEETKEAEVTIADTTVLDQLKGRTLQAKVVVQAIQAYVTPELTDDLAAELGYEGGVDGMREALRMEMQQRLDDAGREQARVKLLQELVGSHEFEVPSALVDEQYEALVEETKIRRMYAGEDPRKINLDEATLQDLRNRGRFAAKASLLLAAIGEAEGIKVEDADMDAKIEEIATQRGQTPTAIRGYLEKEQAMPVLRIRVLEEKVLEWLMENADLTAEAPAPVEPEEAAAEPAEAAGEE